MTLNLARYLNKTILVSIPALFDDCTARPYRLLEAEMNGLWLQSEELSDRLLRDGGCELADMAPAVFVPFAQISGVVIPTRMPAQLVEQHPAQEPHSADEQEPKTPLPAESRRMKKGA